MYLPKSYSSSFFYYFGSKYTDCLTSCKHIPRFFFLFSRRQNQKPHLIHKQKKGERQGVPLPPVGSGYPLQVLARLRLPPGFPLLSLTQSTPLAFVFAQVTVVTGRK
jgi:hypothetical protein